MLSQTYNSVRRGKKREKSIYNELMVIYWMGKHNLMVIPLGDFEIILGIDFLRKVIFIPLPHLDGMMIINEGNPSFIKVVHPYGEAGKIAKCRGAMLSAIVVDKGLGKGETTFLVALVIIKPDVKVEVPDCVAKVLKQFLDLMPPEVPMKMPPRRDIDHKIELLPGSIASA